MSAVAVMPGRKLRSLFFTLSTVTYETTLSFVVDPKSTRVTDIAGQLPVAEFPTAIVRAIRHLRG